MRLLKAVAVDRKGFTSPPTRLRLSEHRAGAEYVLSDIRAFSDADEERVLTVEDVQKYLRTRPKG
jgi:hypothetical protein